MIKKFLSDPYTYIWYCAWIIYGAAWLLGYIHVPDACEKFDSCWYPYP